MLISIVTHRLNLCVIRFISNKYMVNVELKFEKKNMQKNILKNLNYDKQLLNFFCKKFDAESRWLSR